jgi:hypothetical protein
VIAVRVEPACIEPHQGCGCERDASQGSHAGPCEFDGGYGEGGSHVICTRCAAVDAEHKRTACPDCGGSGWVAVAEVAPARGRAEVRVTGARQERCFSCLGTGKATD